MIISKNLSATRVPNPLLKGTLSYLSTIAHLDISPTLGIIIFAAYPVKTVNMESEFGTLYPADRSSIVQRSPLNIGLKRLKANAKSSHQRLRSLIVLPKLEKS